MSKTEDYMEIILEGELFCSWEESPGERHVRGQSWRTALLHIGLTALTLSPTRNLVEPHIITSNPKKYRKDLAIPYLFRNIASRRKNHPKRYDDSMRKHDANSMLPGMIWCRYVGSGVLELTYLVFFRLLVFTKTFRWKNVYQWVFYTNKVFNVTCY